MKTNQDRKRGRVLIASDRFPPDYSGAGLRAQRMIERIREKYDQKFNVLCIGKTNPAKPEESNDGIRVTRLDLPEEHSYLFPFFIVQAFLKATNYLRKTRDDVKIIHLFSFSWMNRMIMLSNLLFYRKKTILEITLDGDDDITSLLTKGRKNKLLSPLTRFLIRRIDKFAVLSEYGLKTCLDFGIPKEKIWLRPNPCDENIFGSISFKDKGKLRKKLGLPDNFLLLNVGIIQPRKNQMFLAKAMSQLKNEDITLLIIGPVQKEFEQYHKQLTGYIKDEGLEKKILFLNEKRNINEFMIASDLFVFASEREGFPNTIAESLISGLPVIMTEIEGNGINRYLHDDNGFIIHDEKNEEEKIRRFVSRIREVYDKKIELDREKIRAEGINAFSASRIDAKYVKAYADLMRGA